VLLLNVANHLRQGYGGQDVIMLPLPMLPIINLVHRPHWKLKIETDNTFTLATSTTPDAPPTKINPSQKLHTQKKNIPIPRFSQSITPTLHQG
jgi:hypothetical protein